MKWISRVLAALVLSAGLSAAAQTIVTATVVDSDSTAWANGTCQALYAPPPNYTGPLYNIIGRALISPNPVSCNLDGSGSFSVTLDPTAWVYGPGAVGSGQSPGVIFTVCPQVARATCSSTAPIVISGSSQSVSTQINAVIVAPRVGGLLPLAQAYNDTEVSAVNGNQYSRLSDGAIRCYASGWGPCAPGPSHPIVQGTITLTAATSDIAVVTGATSSSNCVFSATNSTATGATILPYVSLVATNAVTIAHAATVGTGATYNILCTVD
jgi:hypothetical protein